MSPVAGSAVRESAIAGMWYPGSASELRHTVEAYLSRVSPAALPGRVVALISPHAGYAYSGPVAAHAYAQVRGMDIRRVVLLGPLHRLIRGSRLGAFMVPEEAAYRTPLGDVALDQAFLSELGGRVPLTYVRRDEEHSLEIQLPFLQVALGNFALAPIMLGEHISEPGALARAEALGLALAELCDEHTLLVASTDLSHLDNYADVRRIDGRTVDLVAAFDLAGLTAALYAEEVQACGATGVAAVLAAARKLGARGAQVLAYATSGDVTGQKRAGTYTVGYLAAAVHV